jgi:hypothetical protein
MTFLEVFYSNALEQHVYFPTWNETTLELILSATADNLQIVTKPATSPFRNNHQNADHCELFCQFPVRFKNTPKQNISSWHRMNKQKFKGLLNFFSWNIMKDMNVNTACSVFYDFLNTAIKDCIPTRRIRRNQHRIHFDNKLRAVLRSKLCADKRCKRSEAPGAANAHESGALYVEFSVKRAEFKLLYDTKLREQTKL